MAFKGDTSQISLSNIIQTLQLNRQEGVMTILDGKLRRKVRLLPNGMRILSPGRDNPDVLREVLIKQKIVTDSQFQNIVSTMGPARFPGEFLIQRRILTREQVEQEVAKQLREIMLDLVSAKKAKYEFVTGDPGDELELFDPQGAGLALIFNVSSILMEAARREDDWQRIATKVPSEREIFVAVNPRGFREPKNYDDAVDHHSVQEVKALIDGQHAVSSIADESTLSLFEVFQVMALLVTHSEIRPLTVKEKKGLAEELKRRFKVPEVIEIYRNLLAAEPDDLDTRVKLVQLLEKHQKVEQQDLLLEHLEYLTNHHYQASDFNSVMHYVKRILEFDHHHLFALDKWFEVLFQQKNQKEAVEVAHRLVDAVKAKKEFAKGSELLLRVVDLYPTETFLFHELADFFVFLNQTENAVACLKSVAALHEQRRDLTRLRKTYERIAALDPNQATALRKITEAERRSSRVSRVRLPRARPLITMLLAILVLGPVGYLGTLELLSRRAYASSEAEVKSLLRKGDFDGARVVLEKLASSYPISTLPTRISRELAELNDRERKLGAQLEKDEEKENLLFGSYLAQIESLLSGKRHLEAMAKVREINRGSLGETNRKKLAAVEGDIRKHFAVAEEMLLRGRELIQGGKHEEAHRLFLQLMVNYPSTPASRGLKLPLLVRSTPPGANAVLNGERAGKTPFTLYYDPFGKFSLTIQKEGFRPLNVGEDSPDRLTIDFAKDWFLTVRLERVPAWVFDAKAPVECVLGLGKQIYLGTRAGKVHCLEVGSGKPRWTYSLPNGLDAPSGLRAFQDRICFGAFDGTFHVLQAESGRPIHQLSPFSPPRPIRSPPSEPTRDGMIVVNGGMAVAGVNVLSGSVAWTQRTESEVVGPPDFENGEFVVSTAEGVILLLDPAGGQILRRVSLGVPLQVPGVAVKGAYLAGDAAGRIRRLNLRSGEVEWTYQSPMEEPSLPVVGDNVVFLGSRGGLFAALDLKTGDLKWRGKVNDGIASALWHRGNFYFSTKGGQRLCIEGSSGTALWNFGGGSACRSPPVAAGNLVIFADGGQRVLAFPEN